MIGDRKIWSEKSVMKMFWLCFAAGTLAITIRAQETSSSDTIVKRHQLSSESILYSSPDPENIFVSPSGLAVCPSGRLVAAFQISAKSSGTDEPLCRIYTSDDGGKTWVHRASTDISMSRIFVAGKSLYLIGQRGNIRIVRSDDWGDSWSNYSQLTSGERWLGAPCNVLFRGQYVYLSMDLRLYTTTTAWPVAEVSPHIFRGDLTKDLLDPSSWTISSPAKAFIDYFDDKKMDTLFGIPFYPSFYPDRYYPPNVSSRSASPVGWTEGNVVQVNDPRHQFYDPSGKTFYIFLRSNAGLTNIGSILKVVENDDGTMTTQIEQSPSGKNLVFIPIPGGQQTFYIFYDEVSRLYWLLSNQTTDSMTKAEFLDSDRFGMAYDERRRLALYFSKNLFDWCFVGLAAIGNTEKEARHCLSVAIDGNDLIFLSRSGDKNAKSAHNCNLITFHRIKNFRALVY